MINSKKKILKEGYFRKIEDIFFTALAALTTQTVIFKAGFLKKPLKFEKKSPNCFDITE